MFVGGTGGAFGTSIFRHFKSLYSGSENHKFKKILLIWSSKKIEQMAFISREEFFKRYCKLRTDVIQRKRRGNIKGSNVFESSSSNIKTSDSNKISTLDVKKFRNSFLFPFSSKANSFSSNAVVSTSFDIVKDVPIQYHCFISRQQIYPDEIIVDDLNSISYYQGRPNFDVTFENIASYCKSESVNVIGTFACGPPRFVNDVRSKCINYSINGLHFHLHRENEL